MTYSIYMIPFDNKNEYLINIGLKPYETALSYDPDFLHNWKKYYVKVYEAEYKGSKVKTEDVLEDLFDIFNVDSRIPDDYEGTYMHVSNIIVLDGVPYYCDSIGWKEVK